MKRRLGVSMIVMVIFLVFSFSGCSNQSADTTKDGLTKIKVSHHPYIHGYPTYIAQNEDKYKEDGFDEEVIMFAGGPPQNEALASDQWEVGTTGAAGIFGGIKYGLKVIAFSGGDTNTVDFWVRPDSAIAKTSGAVTEYPEVLGTPEDWKGKQILCPTGTVCHLVLIKTLNSLGLKEEDVEVVHMDVAGAHTAFKAGQGDILAAWCPYGFLAEDEGWVKATSANAVELVLPALVVASEKAVTERPEVVAKWLDLYLTTSEGMYKDKDAAAQGLLDYQTENGVKTNYDNCRKVIDLRVIPSKEEQKKIFNKNGSEFSEAEEAMWTLVDFYISQGSITEQDKQKLIDTNFVDNTFINMINE